MIVIAGLIIGAITGGLVAKRREGNRLDIAQYAGGYAIFGAVIGLFITVGIDRMI